VPEHPQNSAKKEAVEQNQEDPAVKPGEGACRKKKYQREYQSGNQKLDCDRYKHF